MFDGTLGKYINSKFMIKLQKHAKSYHAKPFPIPKLHKPTCNNKVDILIKIGVLKKIDNFQLVVPTFIIPKNNGAVRFNSDFKELIKE